MKIEIQLTDQPIPEHLPPPGSDGGSGAWLEFRGVVRGEESGQRIAALEYEAYAKMAERQIHHILESLAVQSPCLAAKVIHRVGVIRVGETAIYVSVASAHRGEAVALLAQFMDRLKQDVPIWKRRALPILERGSVNRGKSESSQTTQIAAGHRPARYSLDEALSEIRTQCPPLPAVRVPLGDCFGRVLRETVSASTDSPDSDRSTRDGYAILENDRSESFTIVDTLHASDWKPRQLKVGEAARIATGTALPCEHLRVIMQENVERTGDKIRIIKHEGVSNIRKRGEEMQAGQTLLPPGTRLDAGKLALLASIGQVQPLVGPQLRIIHFTTGDEIIPPDQTPKPGQIRDSNSTLIRSLLPTFSCHLQQAHLPESLGLAKLEIGSRKSEIDNSNVLLVSGGASVGDKDFTRPLLEWLGFALVFSQINVRPGRPLIFGIRDSRVAFGLPGNPLSHFVCFHLFIAAALARLVGEEPKGFSRGRLAAQLDDVLSPRETLWPAQLDSDGLHPLAWASSGDLTCLTKTNALIRVPANRVSMGVGAEVEFWPTDS